MGLNTSPSQQRNLKLNYCGHRRRFKSSLRARLNEINSENKVKAIFRRFNYLCDLVRRIFLGQVREMQCVQVEGFIVPVRAASRRCKVHCRSTQDEDT